MPFRTRDTYINCVFTLRRPTHGELSEIMSHVYLFSHVGLCVFPYLLNYITSLYWKLSENYKHGCRNDQPICKNKGRNESNELSSNNLRFFQNNLGLVFHTTYLCIFHSCYLLLHFPLLHFPPVRSTPAISTPAFSVAPHISPFFPGKIVGAANALGRPSGGRVMFVVVRQIKF